MSKGGGNNQMYGLPTFTQQNSSTQNEIPSWLTGASQYGIGQAANILNRGTQAYGGEMAPGLTADQMAAGDMFRNNVGAYGGYYDQARGLTEAGTGAGPQIEAQTYRNGLSNISDYMSPYISNVVDSVSALGQRNLDRALAQTNDQAIGARAFGGSRHGVQEGVATAENNLNTNNLIANLLNSGYGQAAGMLGQDIGNNLQAQGANQNAYQNYANRNLAAGGQMSGIGTAARAAQVGDISNLQNAGTMAQQTQGAQQQAAYQDWLRQQGFPLQALQTYGNIVASAPHSSNANTQTSGWNLQPQQQQSSNGLMNALGLGLYGASTLGGMGAFGGMPGLLGGAYGALTGQSFLPRNF